MNLILSTLFLLLNTNVKQLILSHDLYQCQLKWGLAQEFLKVKNTVSYSVSAHGAGFFFFFWSKENLKCLNEMGKSGKEE